MLRLEAALEPEERSKLEPLERGDLFHDVAESFLRERRERGELPVRDTDAMQARLREMAEDALEGLVAGSPPRFVFLWEREKQRFHESLRGWLAPGGGDRRAEHARPLRGELRPGRRRPPAGEPHSPDPLLIDLGDGRQLRVSGKIDRIDRRADGTLVLRDYKTGKAPRDDGGIFRGGKQLQIPFYILAAARLFPDHPVADAFLDYVDGGRQVAVDPAVVKSEDFRDAAARARGRDRPGPLRAGAERLRLVRLHGRVRAPAAPRAAAADQEGRPQPHPGAASAGYRMKHGRGAGRGAAFPSPYVGGR